MSEICRVSVVGAKVTLSVPHFGNDMAMCPGHVHVISEQLIRHLDEFPGMWFKEVNKRLVLIGKSYRPSAHFEEAQRLFPKFTAEQIYRFVQNTCHDVTFVFKIVEKTPKC